MREGLGSIFLYNLIIVFIVLIFAFLAATLSYYKAFKVNKYIISIIEKYEGYNNNAKTEIRQKLQTIGYTKGRAKKCATKKDGGVLQTLDNFYPYCVYLFSNDGDSRHYSYGIITFINFDFPLFDIFLELPIYTKSDRIYRF
ncbi:MAG: hypothetical protein PHD10_00775 [Bacilli bacterium]|nr:hypothetical protein [Bacilli bacterium]MDD4607655.1 hypothetical protein [Bacilli bacterium]